MIMSSCAPSPNIGLYFSVFVSRVNYMYLPTLNASIALRSTFFAVLSFAVIALSPSLTLVYAATYGEGVYGDNLYEGGTASPVPSPTTSNSSTGEDRTGAAVVGSTTETPLCSDQKPPNIPDLFQIDSTVDTLTLFFSPVMEPRNHYLVQYGTEPGQYQHAFQFENSETGVVVVEVTALQKNTPYYFSVRAGNGCAPGDWSNELSSTIGRRGSTYRWSSAGKILTTALTKRFNPTALKPTTIDTTVQSSPFPAPAPSDTPTPRNELTVPKPPTASTAPRQQAPAPALVQPPVAQPAPVGFFGRISQFFSSLF